MVTTVLPRVARLSTSSDLSLADVAAIIEGGSGPTVDGSRYHEPDFMEIAEDYHTSALRAHRNPDRTELHNLPELDRVAAKSNGQASSATSSPAAP